MREDAGKRLTTRKIDLGVMAYLAGFFILFFAWAAWERKFTIGSDAFGYSFPMRTVAWQMIRQGAAPLWTPHIMSGYPLLAMGQLAIGYPLTWGYLFLPNTWAEQIYLLAPYLLGPAFLYAYCREVGRTRIASLLAGLTFGYGGIMIGVLGLYGFMSNTIVWIPLVLIALERARRPNRFALCVIGAAGASAMSLLSGYPQGFVYSAVIACAYGLFISAMPATRHESRDQPLPPLWSFQRWRPLAVALMAQLLSVGIGAWQLLEAMRAVRRSARVGLEQELFRSRTPQLINYELVSLLAPLYHWEIPVYAAPLSVVMAVLGLILIWRTENKDLRVAFWFAVVVVASLLLTADPVIYGLFNRVPIFKSFQVPMRHSFEWVLAVSVLAAFGWDALWARMKFTTADVRARRRQLIVALIGCALCSLIAALWWRSAMRAPLPESNVSVMGVLKSNYMIWKVCFVLLSLATIWQAHRVIATRTGKALVLFCVGLSCYVESHISTYRFWPQFAKPAARYQTPGAATRFLQDFPPTEDRVYTRIGLFQEEFPSAPRVDPPNVTALFGLHNVAGAEPLILDRYSRALGGVLADTISQRRGSSSNIQLITNPRSHVLDLLNARFVVTYAGLAPGSDVLTNKDGVDYVAQINRVLSPGDKVELPGLGAQADRLALVTLLSNSLEVEQGQPAGKVLVHTTDGPIFELTLRAGLDTAEWAHERPDVRAVVKHNLAPIFDDQPGDAANSFRSYRYLASPPLPNTTRIERIEITNIMARAQLHIVAVTPFDSATRTSTPLMPIDVGRWRPVYNRDEVLILRNERALPRAWLVGEAEAVDGEEALGQISGDENRCDFDPRRTALLETKPNALPALPHADLRNSTAQVTYEANGMQIRTVAAADAILVISQMAYPGWVATVDGQPSPVLTTDFILQGVRVPAGQHTVKLHYMAPAARVGGMISLATLLLLGGLAVLHRRLASK